MHSSLDVTSTARGQRENDSRWASRLQAESFVVQHARQVRVRAFGRDAASGVSENTEEGHNERTGRTSYNDFGVLGSPLTAELLCDVSNQRQMKR